jgi:hypothetical protein
VIQNVKAQQKNATNRHEADELIQRATKLQQVVSNKTDDPPERPKRPKKTSQQPLPPPLPFPSLFPEETHPVFDDISDDGQKTQVSPITGGPSLHSDLDHNVANDPRPISVPSSKSVRTLMMVLENAGWDVTGDCARLLRILDTSLADVLVRDSVTYNILLDDLEAKLNNGSFDE